MGHSFKWGIRMDAGVCGVGVEVDGQAEGII